MVITKIIIYDKQSQKLVRVFEKWYCQAQLWMSWTHQQKKQENIALFIDSALINLLLAKNHCVGTTEQ